MRFEDCVALPIYTVPPGRPTFTVSEPEVVSTEMSGMPVVDVASVHAYGELLLMVVVALFVLNEMDAGSVSVVPSNEEFAMPPNVVAFTRYWS